MNKNELLNCSFFQDKVPVFYCLMKKFNYQNFSFRDFQQISMSFVKISEKNFGKKFMI